ncbi:alpha/beta fold hydrolase [Roseivirga thermotolerans]|nr:alpha/beta fold hydrolase [Roseivirga thermotolerans]
MKRCLILPLLLLSFNLFSQVEGTISLPNGHMYYRTFGGGPDTLLIINGGPGMSSEGFADLAAELGKNCLTIIYDQRGTGKSKIDIVSERSMSMDLLVEDIETLRTHLGVKSWVVFGQSFGGMLASYYTTKHPSRVKGLILSSSGGIDLEAFDDLDIPGHLNDEQRQRFNYWSRQISNGDTSFHARLERAKNLAPAYLYHDRKEDIDAIGLRLTQGNMEVNGIIHRNMQSMGFDCKPGLQNFSQPVLILQGTNDIIPKSIAEKTHALLPHSKLVLLNNCGHYGWLEQPETYFNEIRSFLSNLK